MKTHTILASLALACSLAAFTGCCETKSHDMTGMHAMMWDKVTHAVAVLEPTQGNTVSGVIRFDQEATGVHVHGDISGLAPNSVHGFHVHEWGDDTGTDGMSAGGHYNPEGHPHGGPMDAMDMHQAGDLGNVTADATGAVHIDMTVDFISIAGMKDPIIGRSVVLHRDADDFKAQPAGNAGPRIAVGIIGIAK